MSLTAPSVDWVPPEDPTLNVTSTGTSLAMARVAAAAWKPQTQYPKHKEIRIKELLTTGPWESRKWDTAVCLNQNCWR
jgi:hypothetical protein